MTAGMTVGPSAADSPVPRRRRRCLGGMLSFGTPGYTGDSGLGNRRSATSVMRRTRGDSSVEWGRGISYKGMSLPMNCCGVNGTSTYSGSAASAV